jgi:hypothetical protein
MIKGRTIVILAVLAAGPAANSDEGALPVHSFSTSNILYRPFSYTSKSPGGERGGGGVGQQCGLLGLCEAVYCTQPANWRVLTMKNWQFGVTTIDWRVPLGQFHSVKLVINNKNVLSQPPEDGLGTLEHGRCDLTYS